MCLQAILRIDFTQTFKKKENESKYWVHPILKYREDGELPLLIKVVIWCDFKFSFLFEVLQAVRT